MDELLDDFIDALESAPRAAEVRRVDHDVTAMVGAAGAPDRSQRRWWRPRAGSGART